MERADSLDPELDPTSTTEAVELDEVHTNHLSPMGQVEDIGRFVRGVGTQRLRTVFRVGLGVVFVLALVALLTSVVG